MAEAYPPQKAPWPDKGQPYTYGDQDTTDGGQMPPVDSPEPDEPDDDADDK